MAIIVPVEMDFLEANGGAAVTVWIKEKEKIQRSESFHTEWKRKRVTKSFTGP